MTNETLANMWKSNEDFHQRFLGRPANTKEATFAFREEAYEFTDAAENEPDWNVACEAADVLYTVIGIMRSRDIDLEMFLDAMQHVTSKNNAKDLDNYERIATGKIQRKGRE